MASFMWLTWRRTAWPTEAICCSAMRSGSASRIATSVIAEDISLSSCARQAINASSQNSAIGMRIVAASVIAVGRESNSRKPGVRCNSAASIA